MILKDLNLVICKEIKALKKCTLFFVKKPRNLSFHEFVRSQTTLLLLSSIFEIKRNLSSYYLSSLLSYKYYDRRTPEICLEAMHYNTNTKRQINDLPFCCCSLQPFCFLNIDRLSRILPIMKTSGFYNIIGTSWQLAMEILICDIFSMVVSVLIIIWRFSQRNNCWGSFEFK